MLLTINFLSTLKALYLLLAVFAFLRTTSADDIYIGNERQIRKAIQCSKLSDGNYVFGCSRFYSICSNGQEMPTSCYNGLVLNPQTNQCEYPNEVAICAGGVDQGKLYKCKEPFTCAGKSDGIYALKPCIGTYAYCSGGRQIDQPCAPGTVFNGASCVFPSECSSAPSNPANYVVNPSPESGIQPALTPLYALPAPAPSYGQPLPPTPYYQNPASPSYQAPMPPLPPYTPVAV